LKNTIQNLYRRLSNAVETANCELEWNSKFRALESIMKEFMQYFSEGHFHKTVRICKIILLEKISKKHKVRERH